MKPVNRTYCCSCGSVVFKVDQLNNGLKLICTECNTEEEKEFLDKYTSFDSSCKKCSSELIKIKVSVNEYEHEEFIPRCKECGENIDEIKIDDDRKK